MTDFFSNLNSGIRFPDARIGGSGPLPTSLSGPAGINGDPDGRYNFNGNLLDGIAPYAGADGGRMGSDRNYQQIPHRMQHIIPKLYLPNAQYLGNAGKGVDRVGLSHAVDQGDIAFVIVSNRVQHLVLPQTQYNGPKMQMPSRNAFVNLPTVNYLLAGLHRLGADSNPLETRGKQRGAWAQLADDLGFKFDNDNRLAEILRLVSTRILPYGICAGSEHQGGKHETGLAPVQAAANHVTTMTVDGQNRDLVNYWRASDVSAGDVLIFRLEKLPTQEFTLNHYYKEMTYQAFNEPQVCYQLVPDVFRMNYTPEKTLDQKSDQLKLGHKNTAFEATLNDDAHKNAYDFRLHQQAAKALDRVEKDRKEFEERGKAKENMRNESGRNQVPDVAGSATQQAAEAKAKEKEEEEEETENLERAHNLQIIKATAFGGSSEGANDGQSSLASSKKQKIVVRKVSDAKAPKKSLFGKRPDT